MLGAPVDAVEPLHTDLGELVVGLVEEVRQHPNADRLRVCRGQRRHRQRLNVVCGAPNVTAGKRYPFARVGTTVPHGKGGAPMKIERAKLRGEVSEGMLCSARELGLGQEHDGILELDTDAPPGTPLLEAVPLCRPPAGHRRHPEPPRSPRSQGRRPRAERLVPGAVPAAVHSRHRALDVPPARRAGARPARWARSPSPSRTPSAAPDSTRPSSAAPGSAPRPHGSHAGSRPWACARSTTWWTRPTTSCSSSISRCTRTTPPPLRGSALIVRRARGGRAPGDARRRGADARRRR